MIRIDEFKVYDQLTEEEVIKKVITKYHLKGVKEIQIVKKSIDARNKNDVHYSYSFLLSLENENRYPNLKKIEPKKVIVPQIRRKSSYRPIIVGSGPSGLFCGLTLAENGFKPIIIEQGKKVEERIKDVDECFLTGVVNEKSNVQFGEGGAGTFSDGKLTTGVNSPLIETVLQTFYRFGAPKEITYLAKPHIGTDNLVKIVSNIRHHIESLGGTYYFETEFIDFNKRESGEIEVICNDKCFVTDTLVLATGHSGRSIYKMLQRHNVKMSKKNFSVGVRIEHKQEMINKSQYGEKTKLQLPAADYKLVYHNDKRSCYSFCMCPGGRVIASNSENGTIVTNGMSNFARNEENANGALLVNVLADDFTSSDPLAGMYFQAELEKKAFIMGGSNGNAPVSLVEDYHLNRVSKKIGEVKPTYLPGYKFVNLNELFPDFINRTLKEALIYFDTKIAGFNSPEAVLTAVESRTSSPVTINRDENFNCSIEGIYPCGEGAGYAGGITTAGIDGIKVAYKIMEKE